MTPEGKVKKKVKEYLISVDAWYYMPVSNGMGRVGCPDILVCWNGRFIAIETKAPGKRKNTTANQDREIDGITRAYGLALVVDDVEQVKRAFAMIEQGEEYDEIIQAGTQDEGSLQQAT